MRKYIFATALLASGLASAQESKTVRVIGDDTYLGILPTYEIPDSNRGTQRAGVGMSLLLGHSFTPHFGFEINGHVALFDTGNNGGSDFYQEGGTVDAVFTLNDRNGAALIHPFLLGGVGGVYNDVVPNSRDGASFIYDGGVGFVTKPFYHGVKLRLEGRYIKDFYRADYEDYRGSLGIEIPLGTRVETIIQVPPEHVEVREVIREVPAPFIDTDGDTVSDDLDKCPDTPKGLKVDAEGCVIPDQVIELRGVTFEYNKSRLTPNAETVLDTVTKAFIGQPSLKVEIGGHTDSRGTVPYNLKLSQSRADSVRQYLIGKGAKPEQLTAMGYGKSQLLVKPETNDVDRELNRRVEFKVIGR